MPKKSNAKLRRELFTHRLLVAQSKGVMFPDPCATQVKPFATDGTHLKG